MLTGSSPPQIGAVHWGKLVESLSRAHIAQYAGASGDFNSVHVDEPFAHAAGRPSVIAHGMLTMGLVGTFVRSLAGGGFVQSFGGRFLLPTSPGDTLDCTAVVDSVEDRPETGGSVIQLALTVTTSDGRRVFTGTALIDIAY